MEQQTTIDLNKLPKLTREVLELLPCEPHGAHVVDIAADLLNSTSHAARSRIVWQLQLIARLIGGTAHRGHAGRIDGLFCRKLTNDELYKLRQSLPPGQSMHGRKMIFGLPKSVYRALQAATRPVDKS